MNGRFGISVVYICLILLVSCGDNSSGGKKSTTSKDIQTLDCSNEIINGTGHKKWNTKTKSYRNVCEISGCYGGFDTLEDSAICLETLIGYYSPPESKLREECPGTPPQNASLVTDTSGISTRHECWICNDGFIKDEQGNCVPPAKGKYVDAEGRESACSPIMGNGFKEFRGHGGTSPEGCNFSCKSSHTKNTQTKTCDERNKASQYCQVGNGEGIRIGGGSTCYITSCDDGYDNIKDRTKCEETPSGFYSFLGRKITCPNPFNSIPTDRTGLSSPYNCYSCEPGYKKRERGSGLCILPFRGKYVDTTGIEQSCTEIQGEGFKSFIKNTEGVMSADECDFVCRKGFKKNIVGRTCDNIALANIPGATPDATPGETPNVVPEVTSEYCSIENGMGQKFCQGGQCGSCEVQRCNKSYKPNTKNSTNHLCTAAVKNCSQEIANGKGRRRWHASTNAYGACKVVQCSIGYVDKKTSCAIPDSGKYADKNGKEKSCESLGGTGSGRFPDNTKGVRRPEDCNFECDAGFVKDVPGYACNIPPTGWYANNRGEKNRCDNMAGSGMGRHLRNTEGVTTAQGCAFTCDLGYVKDMSSYSCNIPNLGKYVGGGVVKNCGIVVHGQRTLNTGAVTTATGCNFACDAGYIKDMRNYSCNIPTLGQYSGPLRTERPCQVIINGRHTANAGAVANPTSCNFACDAGYVKDQDNYTCNVPNLGKYVDNANNELPCTNITNIPDFNSWESGPATDDDSCPFSCQPNFVVNGRTCKKEVPKVTALALEQHKSYALFNNGKVERWGGSLGVPRKVNLGSDKAQAVFSGQNHTCVILKNASLDHGRVLCWGENNYGQLGVGDMIDKSVPTAVTFLGSKTAKALGLGYEHTCALLNDDTVSCWGRGVEGQIGGRGSLPGIKIESGSTNNPLSGGTAVQIAAGYYHTCAILNNGSIKCWGLATSAQTGGGTPSLGNNKTAKHLALADLHSCAVLNDDSVYCWGAGVSGNPIYIGQGGVPDLGHNKTAAFISAGHDNTCVILNDKTVKCWGNNDNNELGGGVPDYTKNNNIYTYRSSKVLRGIKYNPLGGEKALFIAVGRNHACAVVETGNTVKCWGDNAYGQAVGAVKMEGGSDGTGTSSGETAVLTVSSTPTPTALEADAGGKICRISLSGGGLGRTWDIVNNVNLANLPTYNSSNNTSISNAIDNLVNTIGTLHFVGAEITLSRSNNDKIEASVNNAVFDGMTLNIAHDDNSGNCSGLVTTSFMLNGGSGANQAEGVLIVKDDFKGFGDGMVNIDGTDIYLKDVFPAHAIQEIVDKIIGGLSSFNWPGKQFASLPYSAAKLNGDTDNNDDCPSGNFCVVFTRMFAGTAGNEVIPKADFDYDVPSTSVLATTANCGGGLVKNFQGSGSCDTPTSGKYANTFGTPIDCDPVGGVGFNTFTANTGAVTTSKGCAFSCRAGYKKNGYTCAVPTGGMWVDNNGVEQTCTAITLARGASRIWKSGPTSDADSCLFSCSAGHVLNTADRSCDFPPQGSFVDANGLLKGICDPIALAIGATSSWVSGAADSKTACSFSCRSGYLKDETLRACNHPPQGQYVDNNGENPMVCRVPRDANYKQFENGPADSANSCPFSCNQGYIVNLGDRSCDIPSPGRYADNSGNEADCTDNIGGINGASRWIQSQAPVSFQAACPFTCLSGFLKNSLSRKCNYPSLGEYTADGTNTLSCGPISLARGAVASWEGGPADAADACPFTCNAGYFPDKRTCRKINIKPVALALGAESSYVLLDNGTIEGQGNTSDPSKIPLKIDLGTDTAQAISAGDGHRCAILKNGNLKYGRLMCWGRNGSYQLGLSDSNDKTTPTAVTHLGSTSVGSLMVKSVAAGGEHTCALLQNDTVRCWGSNDYTQIGGRSGYYVNNRKIRGSYTDPLLGGKALKIAAGGKHSCAILNNGSLVCWGSDRYNQSSNLNLGAGRTAVEVSTGLIHTCAILNNGDLKCWGGYGPVNNTSSAVRIAMSVPDFGGKAVTQVAGYDHTCALLNDKTVKCWGGNGEGQIGGGIAGVNRLLSGTVGNPLSDRKAFLIAAGAGRSCTILESSDSVKCWGKDDEKQLIGSLGLVGGVNGMGTSAGVSAQLTAASSPSTTALGSDMSAMFCKITLSGGTLTSTQVVKEDLNLTYNSSNGTSISDAITNLVAAVGPTVTFAGAIITLSKNGSDKIEATVDYPFFDGMDLKIHHGQTSCNSPVNTTISLSGGGGAAPAKALWAVKDDFNGLDDHTILLDTVEIDLGSSVLTKEQIVNKVVQEIGGGSWTGEQYITLPYTAVKLDGTTSTSDDCPSGDFCVEFTRVFAGKAGNNGIRFPDSDYEVLSLSAAQLACVSGEVKNLKGAGSCDIPASGKYVNNGQEVDCDPVGGVSNASSFEVNTGAVSSKTGCAFSCQAGYKKDAYACNIPDDGSYADANGNEVSCTDISNTPHFSAWKSGTAADANSCPFSCQTGYLANRPQGTCDIPDPGTFVDASGVEQNCNPVGGVAGVSKWPSNTGPVNLVNCPFDCVSGFLKDSVTRECNYPLLGEYTADGISSLSCGPIIKDDGGFNDWKQGAAFDADGCPFTCNPTYSAEGRACRKIQRRPVALSLGYKTSYALLDTGKVEGWGETIDPLSVPHKINVGADTPQQLSVGGKHRCIILKNGGLDHGPVKCWGENGKQQLGISNDNYQTQPTLVATSTLSTTAKSVSVGGRHTCVLTKNDKVRCWGDVGQLQTGGDPFNITHQGNFVEKGNWSFPLWKGSQNQNANAVSAGYEHTCAILRGVKTVTCWGQDAHGQSAGGSPNLGVNRMANGIEAGTRHTCALLDNDSVKCWGSYGNQTISSSTTLALNGGITNITNGIVDLGSKTAVKLTGAGHTCALLNDETVKCWGINDEGQIGGGVASTGRVLRSSVGDPVSGLAVLDIAAGWDHTCAILKTTNEVKCWGNNSEGQLIGSVTMKNGQDGVGTSTGKTVALSVSTTPSSSTLGKKLSARLCGITLSGRDLQSPWTLQEYDFTYNNRNNVNLRDAIDNVLKKIGSADNAEYSFLTRETVLEFRGAADVSDPLNKITFSVKGGGSKLAASVDTPIFSGMSLNILLANGDCHSSSALSIPLSGGSDTAQASGLWVVGHDFIGSGDTSVQFDGVDIDLGSSALTKKEIADNLVVKIGSASWGGKQYEKWLYTAKTVDSALNSDCPSGDFCVQFTRIFPGMLGNSGIPFADSDYEIPSANALALVCNTGLVKNLLDVTCDNPPAGKYANSGQEMDCDPVGGDGFNVFETNTGAVTSAQGCAFSCNAGYKKATYSCNVPVDGTYVDGTNTPKNCDPVTLALGATSSWISGAADSKQACPFSCSSGYIVNRGGWTCDLPAPGTYGLANGSETDCNTIGGAPNSFQWTQSPGAVTSPSTCPYECRAGYVSTSGDRTCNYPGRGRYVNTDGTTQVDCDNLTMIPGFEDWAEGFATARDNCPFNCLPGYIRDGRSCEQLASIKPVGLALDNIHSYVLLNSGEVEGWGASTELFKVPFKIDLGVTNGVRNTAQKIFAGVHHTCIVLTNAKLDHGPLKCWGSNDLEQLGVGDRIERTVPTDVTALGLDASNNPYTAKIVAMGSYHTCAILNDDTVKCWGGNHVYGQIGGTARNSFGNNTIVESGSRGDPLSGAKVAGLATGGASCAILKSDNSVKCWGLDDSGQAAGGVPNLGTNRTAVQVAAGYYHACALLDDKGLKCWGADNNVTIIGTGGVPDLGGQTADFVTSGLHAGYICAILSDDTVKCWGDNREGQIGGTATTPTSSYVQIQRGTAGGPLGTTSAAQIAVAQGHGCAIMTDDTVKCWGGNSSGQIVGAVRMKGGTDGSGSSWGKTGQLTTDSTPSSLALDKDKSGKICKITLLGGMPSRTWTLKSYQTPKLYNTSRNTSIFNAIDNMIGKIGTFQFMGASVSFSRKGKKIKASVDSSIFDGMTLGIVHADSSGDCSSPVTTSLVLSAGTVGAKATGLWVIGDSFSGKSDDTTVHLDGATVDLGTSSLTKEQIANNIIGRVIDAGWMGKQYKTLPYMAEKIDGATDSADDCPNNDFCVLFTRIFPGTTGNEGIPFPDSDYAK